MLTKDVIKEIRAKKVQKQFVDLVNSRFNWSTNLLQDVVKWALVELCPHLNPTSFTISNQTANAVMGKLDRS